VLHEKLIVPQSSKSLHLMGLKGSLLCSQDPARQTSKMMEKLFFDTVDSYCNAGVGASFVTNVISEKNIYLNFCIIFLCMNIIIQ
jgi:hypothetical protein